MMKRILFLIFVSLVLYSCGTLSSDWTSNPSNSPLSRTLEEAPDTENVLRECEKQVSDSQLKLERIPELASQSANDFICTVGEREKYLEVMIKSGIGPSKIKEYEEELNYISSIEDKSHTFLDIYKAQDLPNTYKYQFFAHFGEEIVYILDNREQYERKDYQTKNSVYKEGMRYFLSNWGDGFSKHWFPSGKEGTIQLLVTLPYEFGRDSPVCEKLNYNLIQYDLGYAFFRLRFYDCDTFNVGWDGGRADKGSYITIDSDNYIDLWTANEPVLITFTWSETKMSLYFDNRLIIQNYDTDLISMPIYDFWIDFVKHVGYQAITISDYEKTLDEIKADYRTKFNFHYENEVEKNSIYALNSKIYTCLETEEPVDAIFYAGPKNHKTIDNTYAFCKSADSYAYEGRCVCKPEFVPVPDYTNNKPLSETINVLIFPLVHVNYEEYGVPGDEDGEYGISGVYPDNQEFPDNLIYDIKQALSEDDDMKGLFWHYPFKEYKEYFQFFYVDFVLPCTFMQDSLNKKVLSFDSNECVNKPEGIIESKKYIINHKILSPLIENIVADFPEGQYDKIIGFSPIEENYQSYVPEIGGRMAFVNIYTDQKYEKKSYNGQQNYITPSIFTHEFGHLLELLDEYPIPRYTDIEWDWVKNRNCDVADSSTGDACPRWCDPRGLISYNSFEQNGDPGRCLSRTGEKDCLIDLGRCEFDQISSSCTNVDNDDVLNKYCSAKKYLNYDSEKGHHNTENLCLCGSNCYWLEEPDPMLNKQCVPTARHGYEFSSINTNNQFCGENGLGCFYSCGSVNLKRPNENSIMRRHFEYGTTFNRPSQEVIKCAMHNLLPKLNIECDPKFDPYGPIYKT